MKNTLLTLNQGKFAKFCVAVSFTLVDLKFLAQQNFSLTLQPLRPTLSKVNKTYELYRYYNALVTVLLVRKISKMKFLLSCTSSRQDLRWLRKYYRLEVKFAYSVNFAQLLQRFASHFTFSAPQVSLTSVESLFFKNTYTLIHFLFGLVLLAGRI